MFTIMKRITFIAIFFICNCSTLGVALSTELNLTAVEKDFLRQNPVVSVYNSQQWVPFNFYRNNKPQGYTIDYLNIIADKLGIKFDYKSELIWSQAIQLLKEHKLDLIPNMSKTNARDEFALFTTPIIKYPPMIISKKKNFIKNLSDLNGKKVAIVKGYWYAEALAKEYPDIEIIQVNTNLDTLKAIIFDNAFATIGNGAVLENIALDNNLPNIKICCEADFNDVSAHFERIGIRKDWKVFQNILNKAIESITYIQEKNLKQKWLVLDNELSSLGLTTEEIDFLNKHNTIRVQNENDWAPYNFNDSGEARGYTIDLLKLLGERLNIEVEFIFGPSWSEFLDMMKNKQIDVISNITKTDDRNLYMLFTTPISTERPSVLSRVNLIVNNLNDLKGKTVAVVKNYWHEEVLKQYHPEINLHLTETRLDSIKAVAYGNADATIGVGPVLQNIVFKNNLQDMVNINGQINLEGIKEHQGRLGVRNDWALLHSALNKALASLTYKDLQLLKDKWLTLDWARKNDLGLSLKEKLFLQNHKVISVQNETNWRPFNFNNNGVPAGFSIDYMNIIAKKAGFLVNYLQGKSWNEYLNMFKNKELDVMVNIVKTEEREKYSLFTDPYIINPNVIVSRKDNPLLNIESLKGKKVSTIKGFFYEEFITKHYPEIKLLLFDNFNDCLSAVTFKKADAALGELAVADYFIEENFYTNLQLSGEIILGKNIDTSNLRIGIRDDMPELHSIISKAMKSIPRDEQLKLRNKWINKSHSKNYNNIDFSITEKLHLRNIGNIRLANISAHNPYQGKNEAGDLNGIVYDFLSNIAQKLPVPIELNETKDRNEAKHNLEQNIIDGINFISTHNHFPDLIYTKSYLNDPIVIVGLNNVYHLDGLKSLAGKTIAVRKDCGYSEIIQQKYPEIELITSDSINDCLEMVSSGEAFATIGALFIISNSIQENNISNLKIVGQTEFKNQLHIGLQNKDKTLLSILNKVIDSIDENQRNEILNRWYKLKFTHETDWSLIWKILSSAAVIVILLSAGFIMKYRFSKKMEANNLALTEKNNQLSTLQKKLKSQNDLLTQMSIKDNLTGIYNRRKLDNTLNSELQRSKRFNHPFGLILLDIDKFKIVNDCHGHQVGDEILIAFADILKQHIRETDILGRWGGEEFMIICPEITENGIQHFAEELRIKVSNFNFPVINNKTASFGVTISTDTDTIQSIIERADKALYMAKEGGRDKVIVQL